MTSTLDHTTPPIPAHRSPRVLRWLGAYTASTVGDSVFCPALSWAAVSGGAPAQAGLVMGWTMAIGALAHLPQLALAVLAALAIGLFAGFSGALCNALIQTECDPAYLGRVSAVAGLGSLGIAPLSYPVTGAAIGLWGTGPVFAVSAAVCALSGAYALAVLAVRRAELPKP